MCTCMIAYPGHASAPFRAVPLQEHAVVVRCGYLYEIASTRAKRIVDIDAFWFLACFVFRGCCCILSFSVVAERGQLRKRTSREKQNPSIATTAQSMQLQTGTTQLSVVCSGPCNILPCAVEPTQYKRNHPCTDLEHQDPAQLYENLRAKGVGTHS